MPSLRHIFTGTDKTFPDALTPESRLQGRKLFYRFYVLNGVSVACLMNNVLILYGIRNGLADPTVAIMASFLHLTMPFMILGKSAIARIGAARTRAMGWFFRYVFASLMVLAPFAARSSPQPVVTALILVGAFGFAAFRSIGVAAINPLQGEVAEANEGGKMVSTILLCVQSTYFLCLVLILFGFHHTDEIWLYQVILATGCIVGLYASTIVAMVPESNATRISARKSLRDILRVTFATRSYRRLVSAWSAGLAAKALVIPFTMIALKSGYGVSDFMAMLLTLVMALGTVASGYFTKKFADRVGARFILLIHIVGMMAITGFWAFAPATFFPLAIGTVFFLAGYCEIGIAIGLSQHFLEVVPGEDRVGSSLLMRIASGASAGLAASVLGAGLLRILPDLGFEGLDIYRRYFLIILVPLALLFLIIGRIESHRLAPSVQEL
ncbi:MAG: hypothetical protein JJU29_14680 [Verrucomicrobia bacterium]|nr:hypothetical protein [Verrucomicrobiota bacterium]MCH8513315.1 MFS transporter [Kiritimatiellia bacterium]